MKTNTFYGIDETWVAEAVIVAKAIGESIRESRGGTGNRSELLRWADCYTYWKDCVDVLGLEPAFEALRDGHRGNS